MNTQTRIEKLAVLDRIHMTALRADRDLSDAEYEIYKITRQEIAAMANVAALTQPDPATLRPAPGPTVITKLREYSVAKAIAFGMQESGINYGLEREIHPHLTKSRAQSFQGVAIPIAALFK